MKLHRKSAAQHVRMGDCGTKPAATVKNEGKMRTLLSNVVGHSNHVTDPVLVEWPLCGKEILQRWFAGKLQHLGRCKSSTDDVYCHFKEALPEECLVRPASVNHKFKC